jgi:molecular chaperone DnaJ
VNGGPPGDLYVQVHIKPHPCSRATTTTCTARCRFDHRRRARRRDHHPDARRHGENRVPAETQTGKTFRLKAKGIKGVRSREPGDLFCHVVVETPVSLTERQRQLLREFETTVQADSGRHNPRAKGWLDKVKAFFDS